MIKTINLTKKYDDMYAIRGIDLDLQQGDLFGFIGPRPVGAKHSDKKSTVSPIGYCPNASPVLFQQTLYRCQF